MQIIFLLLCFFISPTSAQDIEQAAEPAVPRFAMGFYYPSISNISNRTDIEVSLSYWAREVVQLTFKLANVYSVLYDDIQLMSRDFEQGKLDIVVAPPLLLAVHFDRSLFADGFVGVSEINKLMNLSILARRDFDAKPENYRNARLVLPANDLLAEALIDTEVRKQYAKSYQQVFGSVTEQGKNKRIIMDLFFDKADIAVVHENALNIMAELNPQIGQRIKVLKRLPMKSRNYSYFHKDYSFINTINADVKLFRTLPRGQQILAVFQASDMDICKVEELEAFDEFYQAYLKLKKNP